MSSLQNGVDTYDLVVVGSGFAGSMTTLNFLEECKRSNKTGRVALIEAGKEGERCGASRWTMAYLRLDKDNNFDPDWIKVSDSSVSLMCAEASQEMDRVSGGLADLEYCKKLGKEVPETAQYLLDHGVKLNHHGKQPLSGKS
jgi:succinate dehydrogenase/fumarate reductase flavoprotein subunit